MASFDPLKSTNNRDPGEYGGVSGYPQPKSTGHPLTPQEKRYLTTVEGIRAARVIEGIPEDDLHAEAVRENQAERRRRMGDWTLPDATQ